MTKGVILPLESYRLFEYAAPIPCYICERAEHVRRRVLPPLLGADGPGPPGHLPKDLARG